MRLSRRAAIGLGLGAAAGLATGAGAQRQPGGGSPLAIAAKPVPALLPREPERRRFGALTYRSGLLLTSEAPGFGGWSGLWRSPDGRELVAISDRADWLTASVRYAGSNLAALEDASLAPILGADGAPLGSTRARDTEALAMAGGLAFLAIERAHEVRRFEWARDGVRARGVGITVPPEVKELPSNAGLEALGVPPAGHPLAGAVIGIAEQARSGDEAPTRGWVLTGSRPFTFEVARSHGFDITDLTFLSSGEALLLERRFRVVGGVACRIRRLPPDAFRLDALVDGEVIFEADNAHEIDNMEGIATHRDPGTGDLVVTLISDDNFSRLQRTLLLEFKLEG